MSDYVTPVLLAGTLAAVAEAGRMINEARKRPRNIQLKGRIDLVTETDLVVENLLKEKLGRLVPEADFMAEESAESFVPGDLTWIIDPLDGTTNFAHGLPMVAISVALWRDGEVILGIVSLPVLDEIFHAVRGLGAFLNGEPIAVTETSDPVQTLVATGFPYTVAEDLEHITGPLGRILPATRGVRRMGAAAVDLAYVSCGRMDAFYEIRLKPWDTAAGWLLVEEAGGRVTRFDPAVPYTLGAPSILATNGRAHEGIAELVLGGGKDVE